MTFVIFSTQSLNPLEHIRSDLTFVKLHSFQVNLNNAW